MLLLIGASLYFTQAEFSGIRKEFSEIRNEFSEIRNEFSKQTKYMKQQFKYTRGTFAFSAAVKTAVKVKIDPISVLGNHYASGSVVKISEKLYVATCRHVVMDTKITNNKSHSCRRLVTKLELKNKLNLSFRQNDILYSLKADLALIPINSEITNFIEIKNQVPMSGTNLYGTAIRENGVTQLQCNIIDIPTETIMNTNCGETHGFSGMGYLDPKGRLVGLHRAQGNFKNFQPQPEFSGTEAEWDKFTSQCDILLNKNCFLLYGKSILIQDEECYRHWLHECFTQFSKVYLSPFFAVCSGFLP